MKNQSDIITTKVKRDTYKKLQALKVDLDEKSISSTIEFLIAEYSKGK